MSAPVSIADRESLLAEGMRRAQSGDEAAYRELLQSLRAVLLVYAERVLRKSGCKDSALADDLVQETLLAVHQKRHTYDPSQLFTPWLFAIARYKLIDSLRKRRREAGWIDLAAVEETLATPVFADPTTATDLAKLLETLPERSRRALELVKVEGLSVAEAAARIQTTESAFKVIVHRALKQLRAKAGAEEPR